MSVQWSAPELATRSSSHVEELRDFFALQRLHFGAAEDIAPLMERIGASESFREDMTSMVRSIILHEGGTIPRANLLEIVAFAIGGRDMDQASLEVQAPLHQLLGFLMSVQRKPWNQPPGESRLQFMPWPAAANRNAAESEADESTPATSAPATPPPGAEGGRVPAVKVIPITARQGMQPVSPVEPAGETAQLGTASADETSAANRAFARPDGVYSRLQQRGMDETAAEAIPLVDAGPGGMPIPVPEPIPPPPPPPPMEEAAPVAASVELTARPEFRPRATVLRPPSALDPEPPSPAYHAAMHLPLALPSLHLPRVALPVWSRAQSRIAALSAGGAVLFIAVLVFVSRSRSPGVGPTAQPVSSRASRAPASVPSGSGPSAAAAVPAKPSAYGPALAHPQSRAAHRNVSDEDYVAKPYSTPVPGQPTTVVDAAPIVRVSPAQPATGTIAAGAGQERAGILRPVDLATSVPHSRPFDPDSTYVRADPAGEALPLPRRPASISSAMMAANLLSAPAPDYPLLAKLAHIQGPVVVRAEVGRNGIVIDASVVSGHHLLRGAAVDAIRQWRFRPYLIDGRPVPVFTTITLNFPPRQ